MAKLELGQSGGKVSGVKTKGAAPTCYTVCEETCRTASASSGSETQGRQTNPNERTSLPRASTAASVTFRFGSASFTPTPRLGIWMHGWEGLFLAVRRMG